MTVHWLNPLDNSSLYQSYFVICTFCYKKFHLKYEMKLLDGLIADCYALYFLVHVNKQKTKKRNRLSWVINLRWIEENIGKGRVVYDGN